MARIPFLLIAFFTVPVMMGLAQTCHAREASAAGLAQATVMQPIAVIATADLDFGIVVNDVSSSAGSAIFSSSAVLVYAGGAQSGCNPGSACPSPHRARFVVTGEQGRAYRVTTPASLTVKGVPIGAVPGATPPPALKVDRLTVWMVGASAARPDGTLGQDGSSTFEIGGRLSIPLAAAAARYQADIPVVVTYL